jgi:DNA-binding NarL/FixJ family response regulator
MDLHSCAYTQEQIKVNNKNNSKDISMYQVLIADDHPLFRAALIGSLVEMDLKFDIAESSTFHEAREHILKHNMDLLLLDLRMPGNEGLLGLLSLRSEFPELAIVVVSANEYPQTISDTKDMGAMGYIPKSSKRDRIHQDLMAVLNGEFSFPNFTKPKNTGVASKLNLLTPKQLKVLHLIGEGDLNKQIAYKLHIKETTVKTHISDILRKLEITNRTQAALILRELSVVE